MSDVKRNARGEQVFAEIIRNRSGMDAGNIDFNVPVFEIEKLSEKEKQNITDIAFGIYRVIKDVTNKIAKADK